MDGAGAAVGGSGPGIMVVGLTTSSAPTGTLPGAAGGIPSAGTSSSLASSNGAASTTNLGATGGLVNGSAGSSVQVPPSSYSSPWGSTNLASKPEECSSSTEREARSVALEKAYVHDVYQQIACHFSDSRYRAWPRVKQFLLDLEPGSFVCDVGK